MASDTPEMQIVLERLDKLEKESRRLRSGVVLATVAALIFLLVVKYRFEVKQPKSTPTLMTVGRLVAGELVLNDKDGHERVNLSAGDGYGQLTLSDSLGPHRESVVINSTGVHIYQGEWPVAELGGPGAPEPLLQLWGNDKNSHRSIAISAVDDPVVRVTDESGFSAAMGSADLETTRTGEKHKTSAASLVLFGKDGKVLWSAP
jgi:hypothetical protein